MISTKRVVALVCEQDQDKRNAMIDKLSAEDAKILLKHAVAAIRGEVKLPEEK